MIKFKLLSDIFTMTYKVLIISFTAFLFFVVAYNVIRRYVFNNSIAWADELARFTFIWVNLLGIIYVFQKDELIKLDFVSSYISRSPTGKYFLDIIEFLTIGSILGILVFYSFRYVSLMSHVSATLAMPMKIVYSILPVSLGFMFIGNIIKFINRINAKRTS